MVLVIDLGIKYHVFLIKPRSYRDCGHHSFQEQWLHGHLLDLLAFLVQGNTFSKWHMNFICHRADDNNIDRWRLTMNNDLQMNNDHMDNKQWEQWKNTMIQHRARHIPFIARQPGASTVQCRYNVVNLLTNIHKRHPIARPMGRGMGCLLWIQHLNLIFCLSYLCNVLLFWTTL